MSCLSLCHSVSISQPRLGNKRNAVAPALGDGVPEPVFEQLYVISDDELQGLLRGRLRSVEATPPRPTSNSRSRHLDATTTEAQLRDVQTDIAKRIQDNERLRLEQHQFAEPARVAGRIAYYLENTAAVAEDSRSQSKSLPKLAHDLLSALSFLPHKSVA